MLSSFFLVVLQLSVQGSLVLLLALLLRGALRRLGAPRLLNHLLWCAVLFQLLCPLRISLNLIPLSTPQVQNAIITATDAIAADFPTLFSTQNGTTAQDSALNGQVLATSNTTAATSNASSANATANTAPTHAASIPSYNTLLLLFASLWLCGALALLLRGVAQYDYLRRHVRLAYCINDGHKHYYTGTGVSTPFILGMFAPRIYLPNIADATEKAYIYRHEQAHLAHGDFLLKPLFYLALCLHWFNPLVWLGMREMAKDIESACDETVLACFSSTIKPNYCNSLLRFAHAPRYATMPLCFGEGDFTRRIKDILNYKKPTFWAVCSGIFLTVTLCLVCLFNPFTSANGGDALQSSTEALTVTDETPPQTPAPTDTTPTATPAATTTPSPTPAATATASAEATVSTAPSALGMTTDEFIEAYGDEVDIVAASPTPELSTDEVLLGVQTQESYENGEFPNLLSIMWPVPQYSYISRWTEADVHNGIDIAADANTAIYAAASGTVTAAGYGAAGTGFGFSIIVDHGDGFQTLYAHGLADTIQVEVGDAVSQGDWIMSVGSSGYATGNHLHFEVIANDISIPFTEDANIFILETNIFLSNDE